MLLYEFQISDGGHLRKSYPNVFALSPIFSSHSCNCSNQLFPAPESFAHVIGTISGVPMITDDIFHFKRHSFQFSSIVFIFNEFSIF